MRMIEGALIPILLLNPFLLGWDFVPFWKRVQEIEDLRAIFEAVPESKEQCEVPFHRISTSEERPPFLVLGVATGKKEVNLIMDTGSPLSVLRDSLRGNVKTKLIGRSSQLEAGEYEMVREVHRTSSLAIGGLRLEDEPVVFLPDEAFERFGFSQFDGVLGATLLSRGIVEIDTDSDQFWLHPFDEEPEVDWKDAIAMVHLRDLNYFIFALNAEHGGAGRFILDTGANHDLVLHQSSLLAKRAMENDKLGIWGLQDLMSYQEVPIYSLGDNLSNRGLLFPEEMIVPIVNYATLPIDGVVGAPLVWSSKRVVLNAREELALFEVNFEPLPEVSIDGAGLDAEELQTE